MTTYEKYREINHHIYESLHDIHSLKMEAWVEHVVFTTEWWFGVTLSIIPWIVWILFHNKNSRHRMLFVTFFITILASFLDTIGTQFGLWIYYYEVLPWLPAYLPWDWALLPVVIIGLLEFKPEYSPFIKAFLFAALSSFVGEPFFEFIGLYEPIHWRSFYSFPIYIVIFLFCYWLSKRTFFDMYGA